MTPSGAEVITKQWTGDVSSDWSDPRNWTPGGVPASGDDVTIRLNSAGHVDVSPGEVAAVVSWLATDAPAWVTGAVLDANGASYLR